MNLRRRPSPVLLMLCLLVMQAQVWASEMLGCRHSPGAVAMTSHCASHGVGAAQAGQDQTGPFDCHRCVLHALVGVAMPSALPLRLPERPGPRALAVRAEPHVREFIPALPERPPRA